MMSRIKAMHNDDRGGVNAVELIILLVLVALAITAGALALGGAIDTELDRVSGEVAGLQNLGN